MCKENKCTQRAKGCKFSNVTNEDELTDLSDGSSIQHNMYSKYLNIAVQKLFHTNPNPGVVSPISRSHP